MTGNTGKKIFILYPDTFLREKIFHGELRNEFEIYYFHDYEKIPAIARHYPGCIVVVNLGNNVFDWLIDEIKTSLASFEEIVKPKLICLQNTGTDDTGSCDLKLVTGNNTETIRSALKQAFIEFGGKGRRNFVRYGGLDERIAVLRGQYKGREILGTVHDISASGLSCSFPAPDDATLPLTGETLSIQIDLASQVIEMMVTKFLERKFDTEIIHVFQFSRDMAAGKREELCHFIYNSLDSKMAVFIKTLD